MKPKKGKTLNPVTPAVPDDAEAADEADPGQVAKLKATQKESKAGKYGTTPVKPYKPSDEDDQDDDHASWIEIELVDMDDQPVVGEAYEITLPDGETVASGTLDENGFARVDGIEPGTCMITFPNLDEEAWEKA